MQTQFLDIYCAGLKSAADMLTATLESARRMQQQQLDSLQSAIEDQTRSVRELVDVRSVDELMALQSRLAGAQLERTMEFWSGLWRAAGDNQRALIGEAQSQLGRVHEGVRDAVQDAAQQRAA